MDIDFSIKIGHDILGVEVEIIILIIAFYFLIPLLHLKKFKFHVGLIVLISFFKNKKFSKEGNYLFQKLLLH